MLRGGFWGYYVKKSGWLRLYGQRIWMLDVVLESIGLSVMISWLSWITLGLIVYLSQCKEALSREIR